MKDWIAFAFPTEGKQAGSPDAGSLAHRDVPLCSADETVGAARERARSAGSDVCVVADGQRVVTGLLRQTSLDRADAGASVEDVMECGPKTFRPYTQPGEVRRYLDEHHVDSVLVTNSDGQLVGILERSALPPSGE